MLSHLLRSRSIYYVMVADYDVISVLLYSLGTRPCMCPSIMSHLTPMNNAVGRFVCQLKRLTLQYCKNGGSSKGIREYINSYIVQFTKENPQLTVYVRQRPGRHPRLVAEYLNGNSRIVSVKNLTPKEIKRHVSLLRTSSGIKVTKLKKWWHTDNPTIQGNWNPFLNK